MSSLRSSIIKLAHTNPELRKDLLPLLKKAVDSDFAKAKGAAQKALSNQEKTTKSLKEDQKLLGGIVGASVVERAIGESEALEGRLRDLLKYVTQKD